MSLSVHALKKRTILILAMLVLLSACGIFLVFKGDAPMSESPAPGQTTGKKSSLQGATLYAAPNGNSAIQAATWKASRSDDAALMSKLAALPVAKWLTDDESVDTELTEYLAAAQTSNAMPVLVAYAIPLRDCGLYSAGGSQDLVAYQNFIDTLAEAIGDKRVTVIIEPDAIAAIKTQDCLKGKQLVERYQALRYAAERLEKLPNTNTYLDAGNSAWGPDTKKLAERLKKAGIELTDGFSLNVSNFQTTDTSTAYGQELSSLLGGAHFVIDTSRNGAGPYDNPTYPEMGWCNPPGRALGHYPTTNTGDPLVDAYLYIKAPGESDGQDPDVKKCHGGPKAGAWWPEYALGLVKRWPANLQPPTN